MFALFNIRPANLPAPRNEDADTPYGGSTIAKSNALFSMPTMYSMQSMFRSFTVINQLDHLLKCCCLRGTIASHGPV